ncbi:RNA polymerase sigma factor [Spirosoma soli]|uniref:RNA polymerase sigma factor n=1 Tax=Spirosoma soli TaxID=1770529 RepID=A0ABW5M866_9BACT
MSNPEEDLWRRFQEGSEQAFTTIYRSYYAILFKYGYHIAQDDELVKDCIQALFVELWKSRQTLSHTTSIKYYLLKAMRRKVYRMLRQEEQYTEYASDAETQDVNFSPELELITLQTTQLQQASLRQAIDQLSNRQKEAITLLYIEGLSYPEISDMMSIKIRTVYNLVHTALESLRKQLNQPGLWAVVAVLLCSQ